MVGPYHHTTRREKQRTFNPLGKTTESPRHTMTLVLPIRGQSNPPSPSPTILKILENPANPDSDNPRPTQITAHPPNPPKSQFRRSIPNPYRISQHAF